LLKHFNRCLSGKEFLVGDRLTVADFALIGALKDLKINEHNDLSKYFTTLSAHKSFQSNVSSSKPSTDVNNNSI
jgi:glutathione S-transferase